jgi:hypothetical protein
MTTQAKSPTIGKLDLSGLEREYYGFVGNTSKLLTKERPSKKDLETDEMRLILDGETLMRAKEAEERLLVKLALGYSADSIQAAVELSKSRRCPEVVLSFLDPLLKAIVAKGAVKAYSTLVPIIVHAMTLYGVAAAHYAEGVQRLALLSDLTKLMKKTVVQFAFMTAPHDRASRTFAESFLNHRDLEFQKNAKRMARLYKEAGEECRRNEDLPHLESH